MPTEQAGVLGHSVCISQDTIHLYELMLLVDIPEKNTERLETINEIIMKLLDLLRNMKKRMREMYSKVLETYAKESIRELNCAEGGLYRLVV